MPTKPRTSQTFEQRTVIVTVFLLLVFAVIAARLFYFQVVKGKETRQVAEAQHSVLRKLLPERGEIKLMDRQTGETFPVATNIKKYLVYAVPQDIQDKKSAAETLASVLGMDSKDILDKITNTEKKYVPIKKELKEDEQQKITNLKLSGIYLDSEGARYYPEHSLLSQTLGFVGYKGDDKAGLYGLERFFETDLAGSPGILKEEKDTAGAWIFGSQRDITPARDGINLVLTVDKTIQFKAESLLKDAVANNGADSGCIIVANPKTGAIMAMAGYPDFNPNEYNKVEDPSLYSNEAATGSYEPGSIFKAITMAAAINEGKVTPDSTYTDTGSVVIDGYTIKNSDSKAHGVQTMDQVLELSLNTGAIFAKDQIGNDKFYEYVKKFGFGRPTGIEVPEAKGNLDNLKANIAVNYDTASFGQGIMVTPLQMIQAYSTIANNGRMMKPYLVEAEINPDGKAVTAQPQEVGQVISAATANMVSAMLVNVVEKGHGKKAAVPGYYIGGKTGTAQVARKDGKPGYEPNNNIGSFIGFGPVENPQFLMLVRIDHPRDVTFAETTAAPVFGQMAQFILDYLHIPPTRK
ncbi:MAG: penicillin-binding protein 2 [Patescibacteria group bacterium]|nr:penicillin-binding protein 2 [Patescibacteria group bacterium]